MACTFSGAWLTDPNCTTNRSTVYPVGYAELRIGYYNGKLYGWGKLYGGNFDDVVFDVDLNGDRKVDETKVVTEDGSYTWAYPASGSSAVAFRVCVFSVYDFDCGPCW